MMFQPLGASSSCGADMRTNIELITDAPPGSEEGQSWERFVLNERKLSVTRPGVDERDLVRASQNVVEPVDFGVKTAATVVVSGKAYFFANEFFPGAREITRAEAEALDRVRQSQLRPLSRPIKRIPRP